jgi:transposase
MLNRRIGSVGMSNVLNEEKKQQVIALGKLGWTLRRIEQATGVRRETASNYLKAAGIGVRRSGSWGRGSPSKPANEVITDSADSKPANEDGVITDFIRPFSQKTSIELPKPNRCQSACEPYREAIQLGLNRGRNARAIWQDMVREYGFNGGYQSVQRFVGKLRGSPRPEPAGIILTAAGEECQVDYGTGPMVREAESGKYRRTRLFVLTLGYSRKSVRLLVFRSSTRTWAELHEIAFRRLGGSPRVVVLDNLKEGVLTPDIYDPGLNPLFKDVMAHYGVVALPCRIHDPDRKGKVESGVGHAQRTPLKGLRFESLQEAQSYLDSWESRWADTRIHGTTKRQVSAMFAEEKPLLRPLPLEPFRYYQYGERVVHLDGMRRSRSGLLQRSARLDWKAG